MSWRIPHEVIENKSQIMPMIWPVAKNQIKNEAFIVRLLQIEYTLDDGAVDLNCHERY
jgi:hypothetical protein